MKRARNPGWLKFVYENGGAFLALILFVFLSIYHQIEVDEFETEDKAGLLFPVEAGDASRMLHPLASTATPVLGPEALAYSVESDRKTYGYTRFKWGAPMCIEPFPTTQLTGPFTFDRILQDFGTYDPRCETEKFNSTYTWREYVCLTPRSWMPPCCLRKLAIITLDVIDALERFNVVYWAEYGTILSAIRHGGFMPNEYDQDFGVLVRTMDDIHRIHHAAEWLRDEKGYDFGVDTEYMVHIGYKVKEVIHIDLFKYFLQHDHLERPVLQCDAAGVKEFQQVRAYDDVFPLTLCGYNDMLMPCPRQPAYIMAAVFGYTNLYYATRGPWQDFLPYINATQKCLLEHGLPALDPHCEVTSGPYGTKCARNEPKRYNALSGVA